MILWDKKQIKGPKLLLQGSQAPVDWYHIEGLHIKIIFPQMKNYNEGSPPLKVSSSLAAILDESLDSGSL